MPYPFDTKEEAQSAANAIAALLDSMGFKAMAKDCRGDRRNADLPRYAQVTMKLVNKYAQPLAAKVQQHLRSLKLI
jgi:hypothetical protein